MRLVPDSRIQLGHWVAEVLADAAGYWVALEFTRKQGAYRGVLFGPHLSVEHAATAARLWLVYRDGAGPDRLRRARAWQAWRRLQLRRGP
jgi:hypothetical protein